MPRRVVYCIAVGLAVVCCASVNGQGTAQVQFARELIRIAVAADAITVDASYVFVNHTAALQRQPLFYPFPVDSLHPFPDSIAVACDGREIAYRERRDGAEMPNRKRADGVLLSIDVPARGQAVLHVFYRQPSLDRSACYILTSTSAWERALEVARFEITVPARLELVDVSHDVDDVIDDHGTRTHIIDRENFLPERDLCLRWRPADPAQR
jgi:hypothetical protein